MFLATYLFTWGLGWRSV